MIVLLLFDNLNKMDGYFFSESQSGNWEGRVKSHVGEKCQAHSEEMDRSVGSKYIQKQIDIWQMFSSYINRKQLFLYIYRVRPYLPITYYLVNQNEVNAIHLQKKPCQGRRH